MADKASSRRWRRLPASRPASASRLVGLTAVIGLLAAGCSSASHGRFSLGTGPAVPVSTSLPAPPVPTTVAAPTTTSTPSAPLAPTGQEEAQTQVPWASVGRGWILGVWSSAAPSTGGPSPDQSASAPAQQVLYLIDPQGGRYRLDRDQVPAGSSLTGWSGDGQRALFSVPSSAGSTSSRVEVMDLQAGTSTSFASDTSDFMAFTQPTGQALLVAPQDISDVLTPMRRLGLDGSQQLAYPESWPGSGRSTGGFLETADGSEILVATTAGFELVGNAGTAIRSILMPGGVTECTPARWWASGVALASCIEGDSGVPTLWLVPIGGTAPAALTTTPAAGSQDAGDVDAWQVSAGTYVQDLGGCGYEYVARLASGSTTTSAVSIPSVASGKSVFILGSDGSRLAVLASNPCAGGELIGWFDAGADSLVPVLGGTANGGSVLAGLAFGEDPRSY